MRTHVGSAKAEGDSNGNVGANSTLDDCLSSFQAPVLPQRTGRGSIEGSSEGTDTKEGEEQGEELEEAEHGGERVWWGIDYRWWWESCESFSKRVQVSSREGIIYLAGIVSTTATTGAGTVLSLAR